MSDSIEEEVNTDPKWKSFLQAFDKNPTAEQLDGREEEVSQTLASATRVADSLLPELRKKHGLVIEGLRGELVALKDKPPAERFSQMDTLLRRANTEKKQCDDDAKKKGNKPSDAKLNSVFNVDVIIDQAEKISHPGLRDLLKDDLNKVKLELALAGQKKTNREYYEAIKEIDISGLQTAYRNAQKLDINFSSGLYNVDQIRTTLQSIPDEHRDNDPYKAAMQQLGDIENEAETIRQSDPNISGAMKTWQDWYIKTSKLMDEAKKLLTGEVKSEIDKQSTKASRQKEIEEILVPIDAVLKQAETVLKTCQVPMVKDLAAELQLQVESVENAKVTAIAQDMEDETIKQLKATSTGLVAAAMAKVQDALQGVPRMMGALDDLLASVPEKNKEEFAKKLDDLKNKLETTITGDGADLKGIKDALIQMTKDVAAVTKQDETELLLKAQFGVTVETIGKFKPNLKGTYEAMCMVPDSHVGQDKLQKVVFDYTVVKPYGEYGDSVVTMQSKLFDYTKVTATAYKMIYKEKPFVVDGVEYKPNHFKVTMLHEIGHSVDDKHNIMDGVQAGSGFGQWKDESSDSVIAGCTEFLVTALKLADKADKKNKIKECVTAAVGGKAPKKAPDELKAEWKTVSEMCKTIEASLDPQEPWYKPNKSITLDKRIYHESYGGKWVSYAEADRSAGPTVSSYQWRAPGEWFACLYSVAWMSGKTPNGVKGLDDWMPKKA